MAPPAPSLNQKKFRSNISVHIFALKDITSTQPITTMADPNAPIPTTLWSAHSPSTPPPDLRDVLSQLGHTLSQLNYTKTLAALLKEAEKKGDAAPQAEEWGKSIEVDRAVDLLAMWEVWREKNNGKLPTLRINAAKQKRKEKEVREKEEGKSTLVPTPHAEESSSEENSSESDEDEDVEMVDKAAEESDSDDSSSEASSSEEDSSDEEEEVGDAKVGAKRKRVLTPESESESSSSEDSSTSSSESEDDAPPAKRAKTVETKAESEDSSSDSSSSDSDSDSDENAGVAVPPTTPAAKAKSAASASSSSSSSASSSSEDSSSSSESESEAPPPPPPSAKKAKKAKKTKAPAAPPLKDSSDAASAASSTTLPNSPTKPPAATTNLDHDELLVSVPALNALDAPHSSTSETGGGVMHPDRLRRLHPNDEMGSGDKSGGKGFVRMPATEENVGKMKKGNMPFSRVPKDTVVDEKFRSNEYDLSVTKGKGFTKEKNKKKRGEFGSVSAFRESVVCVSFGSPVLDVMDDEDLVGKVFLLVEEVRRLEWERIGALPESTRGNGRLVEHVVRTAKEQKVFERKERNRVERVAKRAAKRERLRGEQQSTIAARPKQLATSRPKPGHNCLPDHLLTKEQIADKRDWIMDVRRDLSMSEEEYSDHEGFDDEGQDFGDGYNPMRLKDDTFDFMAGCGFNPMGGGGR
ncbi:jun-like transcription factor [Elasticomyces elasticus]|nr:jun-like transcription factor [Elasticomyces elasticus]KAK3648478.1 jun-like transcription factor [Elasticomyces elasticus]KAK4916787.1 jun-like transcription factor [Elasticomyces elasticus]KAK5755937.1 jun-like transcription factor [Elasticomyces elasticus]